MRELKERGYPGGYTAVKRGARLPARPVPPFEVRFETPPGEQAQVDFARFEVEFADEPGVTRIVWLFSMVLGYSRLIWARFVLHQDLQTVLRCHIAAFEAIGGVPREILYDRMKTAVIGEDADGLVVYNRALVDLARHHGFQPRACRPYRAKTKGKVERPFRYIREDFFLAGSFRNLDDLNVQLRHWLDTVANPRVHATTGRVVNEAFAEEKPALQPLPLAPTARCSGSNGASPTRAWSASAAISTACPTPPAGVSSRCTCSPTRSASSRTARSSPPMPRSKAATRGASIRRIAKPCSPGAPTPRSERVIRRAGDGRPALARLLRGRRPRLAGQGAPDERPSRDRPSLLDRIKRNLVGLRMPRALEILDVTVRRLERGEIPALEAIDALLAEELTLRENRRVKTPCRWPGSRRSRPSPASTSPSSPRSTATASWRSPSSSSSIATRSSTSSARPAPARPT